MSYHISITNPFFWDSTSDSEISNLPSSLMWSSSPIICRRKLCAYDIFLFNKTRGACWCRFSCWPVWVLFIIRRYYKQQDQLIAAYEGIQQESGELVDDSHTAKQLRRRVGILAKASFFINLVMKLNCSPEFTRPSKQKPVPASGDHKLMHSCTIKNDMVLNLFDCFRPFLIELWSVFIFEISHIFSFFSAASLSPLSCPDRCLW